MTPRRSTSLLWVVVPYVCHRGLRRRPLLALPLRQVRLDHPLVASCTSAALLRWGSPLFHFGILLVLVGHVGGLRHPEVAGPRRSASPSTPTTSWRSCIGTVAGFCTVVGLAILIYRRRTVGPVFSATTSNDKAMYVVLAAVDPARPVATPCWPTSSAQLRLPGDVSRRGSACIFYFSPDPELMAQAPDRLPAPRACWRSLLFAFWPFTRLVHVFSAPIGYLTRPYVVYRSREPRIGARAPQRGWERAGSSTGR